MAQLEAALRDEKAARLRLEREAADRKSDEASDVHGTLASLERAAVRLNASLMATGNGSAGSSVTDDDDLPVSAPAAAVEASASEAGLVAGAIRRQLEQERHANALLRQEVERFAPLFLSFVVFFVVVVFFE